MGRKSNNKKSTNGIGEFRTKVYNLKSRGYEALMPYSSSISTSPESPFKEATDSSAVGGSVMRGSFGVFDSKQSNPTPVDGSGTDGLGFIPWGKDNLLPNYIFNYANSLPYTAAALKYIADLTVGLGPKLMYKWARYVGGTVKEYLVPFEHAGILIRGRIREVKEKIRMASESLEDSQEKGTSVISWDEAINGKPKKNIENNDSSGYEDELTRLEDDLKVWEESMKEIEIFLENNNLELHYQKCIIDDSHMDMYFPTYGLSIGRKGQWEPKVVSVGHLPAVCTRMEEMDENWKVNHVYYAEKWRNDTTAKLEEKDVVAYPALNPEHVISDMRKIVSKNKWTAVSKRPTWLCCPTSYPSMLKPYYPQPAWWSIFSSKVYDYASTLIYDKAIARNNATMWGKIIFINLSYLKSIFDQAGATTPEAQQEIKEAIYERVNSFLRKRENNGKTLFLESFLSDDQKTLWKSIEIVDVPQPASGASTKSELEEISSIIFFAMGIHPALIGAVPGKSGSSGGTFQRELQLLKQQQVSPRQRIYLRFLQNIITFNGWDKHATWIIREQVLTTLDRNANGIEEMESKQ